MLEIKADRELLENETYNFINVGVPERIQTNNFGCGIGKDYAMKQAILNHWIAFDEEESALEIPSKNQFVIAIPKHEMAMGIDNLEEFFEENDIPYAHLYGKQHFCTEPNGCTYKDETCSECELNPSKKPDTVCPYYSQEWFKYVVIIPFEQVNILPLRQKFAYLYRVLIYDEMPFREYMEQQWIPPTLEWTVDIKEKYNKNIAGGTFEFSDNVTINCGLDNKSTLRMLKPKGNKQYLYYLFLRKNQANKIYCQISPKGIQLYAFNKNLAPDYYKKVLVNCGTTPISVRKKMFGDDIRVVEGTSEIENPVISVGKSWCKDTTAKYVDDCIEFIKAFEGKKFVVTNKDSKKYKIESIMRAALPDVDIVHYGEIGTNSFNREYDAGFIYGDFHYPPVTRFKYQKRLDLEEIQAMEDSVVEQAMHRCRPILHETTPLIMMTNKKIRDNPVNDMIYPRNMMIIHGTHKLNTPPSHKWGEDHGIDKRNVTDYRNFITLISRFFRDLWTETDIICDGMEKGLTTKEIATLIGKSVSTVNRLKAKIIKTSKQFGREVKKE